MAAATISVDNWSDLANAFGGVGVDDVIVLEGNIDSPPSTGLLMHSTSTLVLDLNGYTLNVTAGVRRAGVGVPLGATLTIQDSSVGGDGTLSAQGGEQGAGIGGGGARRESLNGGTVTITGGTVIAVGGELAAGIGGGGNSGGNPGDGGLTTITGGTVTAVGGDFGAGIGGGYLGSADTTIISGGTVTAVGGQGAAGIGGGLYGFAKTTIISGGRVTAAGRVIVNTLDNNAAGIGSGLCNGLGCDEERVIGVLQILGEPEVGAATTGAGPQGSPITNPQMPPCVGYSADITESPGVWWLIDIEFFGICPLSTPSISVVKSVNGDDANVAPGVYIEPGSDVVFTYVVTNTGNVTLTGISLDDDIEGAITCPETELAPSAFMTCTLTGEVAAEGQYTNVGTVTGTPPPVQTPDGPVDSPDVTDDDVAHYFGAVSGISVLKSVNGVHAHTAPGPTILPGSLIIFRYVVTNTGNTPLSDIDLVDDVEGPVTCPETELAAGESMTCSLETRAIVGEYVNIGEVSASSPPLLTPFGPRDTPRLTADDTAHFVGEVTFLAWTGANPIPVGIAALTLMLSGGMLLVLRARRAGRGAHIVNVRTRTHGRRVFT